jgi:DNA (cytosine-5)-methyltransferase 1
MDEGESVFSRKKSLCDNTLKRILEGLNKFGPTENEFISKYYGGPGHNHLLSAPAGTITKQDHHSLVKIRKASFLTSYYGNGGASGIHRPAPTVTTHDRFSIVRAQYVDQYYGQGKPHGIEQPLGTILSRNHHSLLTTKRRPWVMNASFANIGVPVDQPAPTITADRHYQYLVNPQYGGNAGPIDKPCFTVIARQDKSPLYLATAETGWAEIQDAEGDTQVMKELKAYCRQYCIIDISMRMLRVDELLLITGFPAHYKLHGDKHSQKRFIGNAVPPLPAQRFFEGIIEGLADAGFPRSINRPVKVAV